MQQLRVENISTDVSRCAGPFESAVTARLICIPQTLILLCSHVNLDITTISVLVAVFSWTWVSLFSVPFSFIPPPFPDQNLSRKSGTSFLQARCPCTTNSVKALNETHSIDPNQKKITLNGFVLYSSTTSLEMEHTSLPLCKLSVWHHISVTFLDTEIRTGSAASRRNNLQYNKPTLQWKAILPDETVWTLVQVWLCQIAQETEWHVWWCVVANVTESRSALEQIAWHTPVRSHQTPAVHHLPINRCANVIETDSGAAKRHLPQQKTQWYSNCWT